jgi:hypothetical protein
LGEEKCGAKNWVEKNATQKFGRRKMQHKNLGGEKHDVKI